MRMAIIHTLKMALYALFIALLPVSPTQGAFASPEADSATVPASEMNTVFDVANEEYKAGDYRDAIKLYESLISSSGLKTVDIHYNIGNANFKLKRYGKAIAAYRRAMRLAPRDQDIVANLSYVRSVTRDKIDITNSDALAREIFFFHYSLNRGESEAALFLSYIAMVLFATGYLFRKSKILRWLTVVSLGLTLTFGVSVTMKWYGMKNSKQAVVVATEADAHTGPGHKYMVSFTLHDGAELTVRKHANGWRQVELPDGRRGWLKESYIEIV